MKPILTPYRLLFALAAYVITSAFTGCQTTAGKALITKLESRATADLKAVTDMEATRLEKKAGL